jgi:hypothetical protein
MIRCQVLKAMSMKVTALQGVAQCSVLNTDMFQEVYYLHHHSPLSLVCRL